MPRRVRPVTHEDELTLVEHLDELRSRLIVCLAVFGVALALCFWQSSVLLEIASNPLPSKHQQLLTFGVTEPFTTTVTVAAVNFLLGFNDSQFNVQVRARDYYSFFSTTMLAGGVIFELPLAIIAVTRLGIVSVDQLTSNRRYAYLLIAILAAALPGVDPVSMLLEMVPLLILFELSILLARVFEKRADPGGMVKPSTQER